MKKKLALLFVLIMVLSSMPVMAAAVSADPAGAASDVTTQAAKNGWVKSGTGYMFYVNGKAYKKGIYWIGGKRYGFDANGKLCRGWFKLNGHSYFASNVNGAKGYGEVLTGYRLYFFSSVDFAQRRTKGWFFIGNTMYYIKADGTVATNTTIDGYRIGGNGAVTDTSGMDKKAQGYSSSTRYLILVNKKEHKINIYQGSKGSWAAVKRNMICTIGKSSTPSPSGSFHLDHKSSKVYGYKDFKNSTAFFATRISAGNYFHSITYKLGCRNPYTHTPKDASLGKSKSNSCIRLSLENAKFIHQVTPRNTRVIVY